MNGFPRCPAAVLTVSDGCARGLREDQSGPALAEALQQIGFEVVERRVVADEEEQIAAGIVALCGRARVVVTTGGTGISPRDVTPEATRKVCDRILEGMAELMRFEGLRDTPYAPLSRAVCGTRKNALVLNVPGSPRGALASIKAVAHLFSHALDLLDGKTSHENLKFPDL